MNPFNTRITVCIFVIATLMITFYVGVLQNHLQIILLSVLNMYLYISILVDSFILKIVYSNIYIAEDKYY